MLRGVRLILPAFCLLALPVQAAVFTVTKTADTLDGACDHDCSLREAVSAANTAANTAAGMDVVKVPAGIYTLSRTGAGEDANATGDLDVTGEMLLVGAGAGSTIVDGFNSDRVLHLRSETEIYGVTIRKGKVSGAGGGIYADSNDATTVVFLHHSVVQGNRADFGGGIEVSSVLVLRDSAVLDNRARSGGGIAGGGGMSLSLTNVTVSNNSAELSGGGLSYMADSEVTIAGSTIAFNYAVQSGGGIHAFAAPYLAVEDASLIGSIVAENRASEDPDCSRERSLGYNVIGVAGSCELEPTDRAGTASAPLNAHIGPLDGRFGSTPVHFLHPGSPALGLVPASSCGSGDQVGQARSAPCEAGAWELAEHPVCVPGGPVLCLQEGRFRVTATWRTGFLTLGDAQADPLTDDTGNYWFFSPDNLEVMVKILNGCGLNQRWWVFTSGLTDVGVTLNVEELATHRRWTHTQEAGTTYAPVLDTDAFPCTAVEPQASLEETPSPGPPPAILVVTKTADTFDGACDHDCSLREAVAAANGRKGLGVIVLGPGVYELTRLGPFEDASATGDLNVFRPLVILGAGAARTILDGSGDDRVLYVMYGGSLELHDVTVRNGRARTLPQNPAYSGNGGGIRSAAPLTLVRSWITGNHAENYAGGIYADDLEARDSTVSGNTAQTSGGGIWALLIDLENVTISGNRAGTEGGGVQFVISTASLRNVTITGNTALYGGGLAVIAEDTCPSSVYEDCADYLDMYGNVIAGNFALAGGASSDCLDVPPHSGAFNLFGVGDECLPMLEDLAGSVAQPLDPRLSPLGGIGGGGGPTPTHVPLAGSPALDLGPLLSCPAEDQRGQLRPAGTGCDAGSVEILPSACQPDENTLCLGAGDRFQVTVRWTAQGKSETGKAVPLRLDSGAFWFFDPANVELTVKVLDGCSLNGKFWVFLTGLTDVGVEVTVEDMQTNRTWTHNHAAGTPLEPRLDTNALDSCLGN
jgi:CSLREA domain-containing protein